MEYERLIGEMCDLMAIDAREVLADRHITINDSLVALLPPVDELGVTISALFDLGPTFPDRDQELFARMLAANADSAPRPQGYFCFNARSARAAWRVELDLREIASGQSLASRLAGELATAKEVFDDVLAPR